LGLAQRARIVLLAADGLSNTAIAAQVGVSRPTVIGWRGRYEQRGMKGLAGWLIIARWSPRR
jgi:transposase